MVVLVIALQVTRVIPYHKVSLSFILDYQVVLVKIEERYGLEFEAFDRLDNLSRMSVPDVDRPIEASRGEVAISKLEH